MGEEGKYPFLRAQSSVSHILAKEKNIFFGKAVIRSLCRLMIFKMCLVKPEKVKGE